MTGTSLKYRAESVRSYTGDVKFASSRESFKDEAMISQTRAPSLAGAKKLGTWGILGVAVVVAGLVLSEERELLTGIAPAQIQAAQKVILALIQKLDQAGELVMTK
jgi:hypothetical protein